jgi:hypothetical protein
VKEQDQEDNSEDDGEKNRSMDNIKGKNELCALKELGFVLKYNLCSIEAGIRMYQKGELTAVDVGTYGLEEGDARAQALVSLARSSTTALWCACEQLR